MAVLRWLTPDDIPGSRVCRVLLIPDDLTLISSVAGALDELTKAYNWEQFGAETPDATADAMLDMLVRYLETECVEMPVGAIHLYAGSVLPRGFLWCNGTEVLEAAYPDLFDAIGYAFDATPTEGYFRLPDLRGRVPVGAGTGAGLTPRALADEFGTEQHGLSVAELAAHTHSIHAHLPGLALAPGELAVDIPNPVGGNTGSTGSGTPFGLAQPSLVLNAIIRYLAGAGCENGGDGVYPLQAALFQDQARVLVGNPLLGVVNTYQAYAYYCHQDPAANGDSFEQNFYLAAGDYTLYVQGITGTNRGKLDWYIDDSLEIAGQDWYQSPPTYNVIKSGAVTVATDGNHTLRGTVNGKHASATDYKHVLTKLWLEPA